MNQVVGTAIGAVIFFVLWAALISWAWETHWMAGLVWTATPIAIAAVVAMKYIRS